jgi:hypothetical protein
LETTPGCSADAVEIAVPRGTALPGKPGCSGVSPPAAAAQPPTVTDKVKAWLKHIVH